MVFTLASNVPGQVLPWRALAKLCRERGICCIGAGAQVCGILPVTLEDGFHILCTAGHKGLYGAPGTGLLRTDGSVKIRPLMQGGTGSTSQDLSHPDFLPDALESALSQSATLKSWVQNVVVADCKYKLKLFQWV